MRLSEHFELRAARARRRPAAARPALAAPLSPTARMTISQRFSAEKRPTPTSSVAPASSPSAPERRARSSGERSAGENRPGSTPIGRSRHCRRRRREAAPSAAPLAQTTMSNIRPRPRRCRQNQPNQRSIAVRRRDAAEPAISISRHRIGVHHQRARGGALPAADHGRARPGRRCLDMVGPPLIERRVKRRFVVEIAVAPVDRQLRRRAW